MRFGALIVLVLGFTFSQGQSYRTFDGTFNNLDHPEWGASDTRLKSLVSNAYSDQISTPAHTDFPNPRLISNALFDQHGIVEDHMELSDYAWAFGQFLDHDIILTEGTNEFIGIPVPAGDIFFDPSGTGDVMIPMTRSRFDPTTGTDPTNPRVHINQITAWIDGSNVYGSDSERASWLRTYVDGKLKVSSGNMLPFNTLSGELGGIVDMEAPEMAIEGVPRTYHFVAGDIRANEHALLATLHTLFVREHNRLCDVYSAENPTWSDEELYQRARAVVIGQMQSIVYNEWLPTMGVELQPYIGYFPDVNPSISNVFATAAFRLGHTLINNRILRLDRNRMPTDGGSIELKDAFFNPDLLLGSRELAPFLRGMGVQMQQRLDCKIVNGVRNFLFGAPGAGGLDLAALNINRGRERGLPDFNTIRGDLGLQTYTAFEEICSDPDVVQIMELVYGNVDRIDPWVGMLAEDPMPGALFGETIMFILMDQFGALRDGDRFYFENNHFLTDEEKAEIRNTRFSDIILRNSNVEVIQHNVFRAQGLETYMPLEEIHLSLSAFPNPTQDVVTVGFRSVIEGVATFQLIDTYGRVLQREQMDVEEGLNVYRLERLSDLPPGIYRCGVELNHRMAFISVVKQP